MSLGFPRGFQDRLLAIHQGRLCRFQRRHIALGFPRGFQDRRLAIHQGRLRRFQRRHIALAICHQIILRRGAELIF